MTNNTPGEPRATTVPVTPNSHIAPQDPSGKTFFGQPRMLSHLFSVEMWERFSFYGMQGLIAYYMYYKVVDGGLGIPENIAVGIVGAYGGSVYLSSILGAWIADRLLGSERTMFYSALLIMAGHISLALIPSFLGLGIGLFCIAIGSGGLKTTCVDMVGHLYEREDPRRDAGFSLYYMGVNIGGLAGPLLTGLAWETWGFHFGFGLAAIGMAIGLILYTRARRKLPRSMHHVPNPLPRSEYGKWIGIALGAIAVIIVAVLLGLLNAANLANVITVVVIVSAIAIFTLLLRDKDLSSDEHSRVISFIPMFIATAAFFALFQQQFTVIAIYADTRLNLNLFGWEMPPSWVQSINPVFIILLAPVFAAIWTKMGRRQPTTPIKFGLALLLIGAAFLTFLPMVGHVSVPLMWIALILLIATLGELMLSPVGLSLTTKLAPNKYPAQMVALNNLAVSLGTTLSGVLAMYYTSDTEGAYFGTLGLITAALGIVLLLLAKPITRLMRGVR